MIELFYLTIPNNFLQFSFHFHSIRNHFSCNDQFNQFLFLLIFFTINLFAKFYYSNYLYIIFLYVKHCFVRECIQLIKKNHCYFAVVSIIKKKTRRKSSWKINRLKLIKWSTWHSIKLNLTKDLSSKQFHALFKIHKLYEIKSNSFVALCTSVFICVKNRTETTAHDRCT